MKVSSIQSWGVCGVAMVCIAPAMGSWTATKVVGYEPGADVAPEFADPTAALAEPSRFTGANTPFPGAVTPFNPAFAAGEIVSIGQGGFLTLGFDRPIRNLASNPFGIDLLVFGNAGFLDTAFPNGVVGSPPVAFEDPGVIEVSNDGLSWYEITQAAADTARFPTLGYLDLSGPFDPIPGTLLSDYRKPVDPALDPSGLNFNELVAAYDGSGGGVGVDLAWTDLDEVNFVRISNPLGSGIATVEVDAITIVPAPAAVCLVIVGGLAAPGRRR
ncbi:MAG: hypothetical protein ACTS3F_08725 [Phycisphaerales bacterium]